MKDDAEILSLKFAYLVKNIHDPTIVRRVGDIETYQVNYLAMWSIHYRYVKNMHKHS
jgi:hypothetical protein